MDELIKAEETGGQLLQRLGVDGKLWAEEMHKRFPSIAVDDLLGWCCNMVMAGFDEANRRARPQPADEREAFERYASAQGYGCHKYSDGTYRAIEWQQQWVGWQARGEYEAAKASSNEANPHSKDANPSSSSMPSADVLGRLKERLDSADMPYVQVLRADLRQALSALPAPILQVDEDTLFRQISAAISNRTHHISLDGGAPSYITHVLGSDGIDDAAEDVLEAIRPYLTRQPAEISEDEAVNAMLTGYCGYIRKGSTKERMTRAYRALQAKCHITRRAGE